MESSVTLQADRIVVEHLELHDPQLAAFVADRAPNERAGLVERALRIGLETICNAGVSLTTDVVRTEFARLTERLEETNARAAEALEQQLRANFADGDGRLPRTLEAFLGDEGKLRRLVGELFDPNRREGAMGQLRELLGRYFDGDASQLARLLDPTREGSPLHQFRNEVTGEFRALQERLTALEAGEKARAEERARGTAKGTDFEDALEARLSELARAPGRPAGADEQRRRRRAALQEGRLRAGHRSQPDARGGPAHRHRGQGPLRAHAPLRRRAGRGEGEPPRPRGAGRLHPAERPGRRGAADGHRADVYCVYDPDADEAIALEAAVRLARALALASLRESSVQLDVPAVQEALAEIQRAVGEVQGMKSRLTSISKAAGEVSGLLDSMRLAVLRSVRDVEAQLDVVDSPAGTDGAALTA